MDPRVLLAECPRTDYIREGRVMWSVNRDSSRGTGLDLPTDLKVLSSSECYAWFTEDVCNGDLKLMYRLLNPMVASRCWD
jgi:hypothetical protein